MVGKHARLDEFGSDPLASPTRQLLSVESVNASPSAGVCRAPSLKVRMHASLLCGDTASWIVDEHGIKKVKSVVIQIIYQGS